MIFGAFDLKFYAILLFLSLPGHPMDHAHNLSPPPALGWGAEMGGGMGRVHKRKMGGKIFWAFEGGERGRQTFAKKREGGEFLSVATNACHFKTLPKHGKIFLFFCEQRIFPSTLRSDALMLRWQKNRFADVVGDIPHLLEDAFPPTWMPRFPP